MQLVQYSPCITAAAFHGGSPKREICQHLGGRVNTFVGCNALPVLCSILVIVYTVGY